MTGNEGTDETKRLLQGLYDAFNMFYYGGECVPEYSNLKFRIDFLEETAPAETEGYTELHFDAEKDAAEITIKIKKSIVSKEKILHLSAVLLHEMVHANMYANNIFELSEDKKEAIHGEIFRETAKKHGLQDGFIIPNDEILIIMNGG